MEQVKKSKVLSTFIQDKQNTLIQLAQSRIRLFVNIQWEHSEKSINSFAIKNNLAETLSSLKLNYSNYYKEEYKIQFVTLKEIVNKNLHFKFKLTDIIEEVTNSVPHIIIVEINNSDNFV
jgi:hypothetical protein